MGESDSAAHDPSGPSGHLPNFVGEEAHAVGIPDVVEYSKCSGASGWISA